MVASLGMLIVLEIAPEMKLCAAAIMVMWLSTLRYRLPFLPQGLAQSKMCIVLFFQNGAPSKVMVPQTWSLASVDVGLAEAKVPQQIKGGIAQLLRRDPQRLGAELLAQRPLVEHEPDVKGRGDAASIFNPVAGAKAMARQMRCG